MTIESRNQRTGTYTVRIGIAHGDPTGPAPENPESVARGLLPEAFVADLVCLPVSFPLDPAHPEPISGAILLASTPDQELTTDDPQEEPQDQPATGNAEAPFDLPSHLPPHLPVVAGAALSDRADRSHFMTRVCGYARLQSFFAGEWSISDLVGFHTSERLLLIAHDPPKHKLLGRLIAKAKDHPREELRDRYRELFLTALEKRVAARKHYYVLDHIADLLEEKLSSAEQDHLRDLLDAYLAGDVPLAEPLTRLGDLSRTHGLSSMSGQTYLEPHPLEWAAITDTFDEWGPAQ